MSKTNGTIMVVGGYGEVGTYVVQTLLSMQWTVIVAGRSPSKGKAYVESLKNRLDVSFLTLDVTKDPTHLISLMPNIAAVIMCTDQPDTNFVKFVLENGVKYLDFTPLKNLFQKRSKYEQNEWHNHCGRWVW